MDELKESIYSKVISGRYDTDLDDILRAVHLRKKRIALRTFRDIEVSDHAILVGLGAGAKYLNGEEVVVKEKRQVKVLARFVDPTVVFRGRYHEIVVSPQFLKLYAPGKARPVFVKLPYEEYKVNGEVGEDGMLDPETATFERTK